MEVSYIFNKNTRIGRYRYNKGQKCSDAQLQEQLNNEEVLLFQKSFDNDDIDIIIKKR